MSSIVFGDITDPREAQRAILGLQWEDLRFPATVIRVGAGATHPEFDTTVPGLRFRHTHTDVAYVIAQLPHSWAEGTDLRPHVHWTKTTAAEGGVYWELAYKWASIGGVADAAWTILASAVPAVSDADLADRHALTNLGTIPAAGRKISDMLLMRIRRVHDHATDTYGAVARLLEFDIHHQVDGTGSATVMAK
jgi:hypothetical protein